MTKKTDVKKNGQGEWYYSENVKKHFFDPQNILLTDPKKGEFDAEAEVGSPACGDVMRMWIRVNPKTKRIKKLRWRTFGCASAIASTSIFSEMVMKNGGMTIEEALKITPNDIIEELGGLPQIKIHCSVLADQAFKKAIESYYKKRKEKE